MERCLGEAGGCSGVGFELGTGKLQCANRQEEGCCAAVPTPGGNHFPMMLLCSQCWDSIPALLLLVIYEAQTAACSSAAALGLEVLELQQSSVMGTSTHSPGAPLPWGWVRSYEKDTELPLVPALWL